jgi:hypothetical protein
MHEFPKSIDIVKPSEIPILDYISKDTSQFRTMNLALSTFVGASGYNYYSQFGISEIKGGGGIWFSDYLSYLFAAQNSPAKFWAVLNNKYVIADQNISIDGLSYIGKFKECNGCPVWEAYGPYLYKNELFLPRYYIVPNSILLVGDNTLVKQLIYAIMLQNWEPKNTVLIEGTTINEYDVEFLKKFDVIFLVRDSLDQNGINKLREYVSQGGVIVPDIFNEQNSISNEDVNSVLNNLKGDYKEVNVDEYSNNKVVIELDGKKGWFVASERFAHFSGWGASINGKDIEMFKADNAITALFLEGEKGRLVFKYNPDSYRRGKLISLVAVIIIVIYFCYLIFRKNI